MQRADVFGQEDGVPVRRGGVGQVAGWSSAAPVEGNVSGHARAEGIEVGVRARAFDAHNLVECAQPVTVHQSCVVLSARNRVGVRGQGEFVDDRRVGVGQGQRREAHAFFEASAVWAEGGSRALVIAMVVVVGDSPTNLIF